MNSTPFSLTFGVELEFIVRYDSESFEEIPVIPESMENIRQADLFEDAESARLHKAYGSLVRQKMVQLLNENGIPTNPIPSGRFQKNFGMWTVHTDSSVLPLDLSGSWYSIELISPVLDYSPTAVKHVREVVELLVYNFSLYTNESCGLHVHVGNGNRGFSMRTLKNFFSLITVFEDQLDSLHTIDRVNTPYAKSFTGAFYPSLTTRREILSAIDRLEMHDLVRHGVFLHKKMSYNFSNLSTLRTIEFRQHRGTLDPELISNWVMVVCNLIDISYADKASFHHLIEKHSSAGDTKYSVIDLFKDLGLSDLADFYEPITVLLRGTDQSPAEEDEFEDEFEDEELTVTPGRYFTSWEKKFVAWPRLEQTRWASQHRQSPGLPIVVSSEDEAEADEEWEVLEIVDCRQTRRYGIQYKATYIGNWDEWNANPPWQLYGDFANSTEKIRQFHLAHPRKPGPPSQLAIDF